ncbi:MULTISPECIES: HXXEE domain-containing protein [Prevotellaceae]|uniref:HXXEE domain-containing protein n=1 Tax=Prevotellaceae TaxID=171552 RepID=UPI0009DCD4BD|nr:MULTISPECIES: HXXEE domain-containing protein [Prevotellaceae]
MAYATEIWLAIFMAFSIHLIIHIIQSIVVKNYIPKLVTSFLLLPFSYKSPR